MTPPDPANDERPPLWPGMSRQTEGRVWQVVSWTILAVIWGGALLWLNAQQWIGLGLTIGVASIFIIGAAIWRLIAYGRA